MPYYRTWLDAHEASVLADDYIDRYDPEKRSAGPLLREWVCEVTSIPEHMLTGPGRVKELVSARALLADVLRASGMSYPQIACFIGRTDHNTVYHLVNYRKVKSWYLPYREVAGDVGAEFGRRRFAWADAGAKELARIEAEQHQARLHRVKKTYLLNGTPAHVAYARVAGVARPAPEDMNDLAARMRREVAG